jgi:hypothetical protein
MKQTFQLAVPSLPHLRNLTFANFNRIYFGTSSDTLESVSHLIMILLALTFMLPLFLLTCIQTKNMITNETSSERAYKNKTKNQVSSEQDKNASQ